jgi:transglutaminase-like putative cysteine protease
MSWRIGVHHRTGYRYTDPVRSSYNEARMTPLTTSGQTSLETRITVSPPVRPLRYVDYWGTVVHAFDVHVAHTELVVDATAIVETPGNRAADPTADWEALRAPAVLDRYAEFLAPSRYVVEEDEVSAVAADLAAGVTPAEAGRRAVEWVSDHLTYERGATHAHTTSSEARIERKGVCQDYTHVTLALLRAMGLPCRYVSGYLYPSKHEAQIGEKTIGESHAWIELWAGDWMALDPTSATAVGNRHVVVARGRDYADVRPLAGVYHGPPVETLGVTVELTRLR